MFLIFFLGLDRLDSGLLKGTPRLEVVSITKCALVWLHPHSLAPASSSLKSLDLSENLLTDVGQVCIHESEKLIFYEVLIFISILALNYNTFQFQIIY